MSRRPLAIFLVLFLLTACRTSGAPLPPSASFSPVPTALSPTLSSPTSPSAAPTAALLTSTAAPTAVPTPSRPPPAETLAVLSPANAAGLVELHAIDFGPWALVNAVAVSPDGQWLAAAAGENIHLYRVADWQPVSSFRVVALTHGLTFSPDSLWLAAASRDGRLRVWQTAGFASVQNAPPGLDVEAHRKGANTVAFTPVFGRIEGSAGWLLASGGNDAMARFWDLSNGENVGMMVGGTFAVPSIAFTPDGTILAVMNGDRIRLREVGSERITGTFASDAPLYSLAVSPDGRWVAVGGSDNQVRLYDPETAYRTGQEQYPDPLILGAHTGLAGTFRALVWQVAFSPAGDLLASVGGDGALRLWDVAAAGPLVDRPAHRGGAASVSFHPSGAWLATGGLDGVVRIWGIRP